MYVRQDSLGDFTPVQEAQILEQLEAITQFQEQQARARRLAFYAACGSALFAAAKLGFVAVPFIRKWRPGR